MIVSKLSKQFFSKISDVFTDESANVSVTFDIDNSIVANIKIGDIKDSFEVTSSMTINDVVNMIDDVIDAAFTKLTLSSKWMV